MFTFHRLSFLFYGLLAVGSIILANANPWSLTVFLVGVANCAFGICFGVYCWRSDVLEKEKRGGE